MARREAEARLRESEPGSGTWPKHSPLILWTSEAEAAAPT